MKKIIVLFAIVASAVGFCSATNETWYVIHRESARYCMLTPTNLTSGAGVVVRRLGKVSTGVPKYSSAEIVRLFGGDEIDFDLAENIDREFKFWRVNPSFITFVPYERAFVEIWRGESAGNAD